MVPKQKVAGKIGRKVQDKKIWVDGLATGNTKGRYCYLATSSAPAGVVGALNHRVGFGRGTETKKKSQSAGGPLPDKGHRPGRKRSYRGI